jgi:hypothetical protein
MKIVDPLHRPGHRGACGPRNCACGCLSALIAAVLGLPVVLGWLISGEPVPRPPLDREAARHLQQKINLLGSFYDPSRALRSEPMPTTTLSESEINSYVAVLLDRMSSPARDAVRGVRVGLGEGRIQLHAAIDLNPLGGTIAMALPWPFQVRTRLDLQGVLEWVDGKGRLRLQWLRAGSIEMSGESALALLGMVYPAAQPTLDLMEAFPLPFGTTGIRLQQGRIVIEGSR